MSIDLKLTKINAIVTEQTNEVSNLKTAIEDSWQEIDKVHQLAKQNHQAARDWQTKTGKVTFKDLNNTEYQVDTLATLINETQKINPHPEVMTKAQFDALRQMRKQQYAGSGFVQWGKHRNGYDPINEGMYTSVNGSYGVLFLGDLSEQPNPALGSKSRSDNPQAVLDGCLIHISRVYHNYANNRILFPPAPDGTKTYDSATGTVTQHPSAAEAFQGQIQNGSLQSGDTSGWVSYKDSSVLSVVDGHLQSVSTGHQTPASAINETGLNFPVGTKVRLEFNVVSGTITDVRYSSSKEGHSNIKTLIRNKSKGRYSIEYVVDHTTHYLWFEHHNDVGNTLQIDNISVRAVSEQVITSRKDLVFLESWHEKIADKDVVYPLGNVQYGANSYEGITLANNLVAQGYSAFGQWDTNTKGYCVKWSTLSDANRVKFLKNPEHNIYYDPEAKAYIQVRYRVRVIEGYGDDWQSYDGANRDYNLFLADRSSGNHVIARGSKIDNTADFHNGSIITVSYRNRDSTYGLNTVGVGETHWGDRNIKEGKCFAIPIALVQRLNQGAYHPTYNPMGCRRFLKTGLGHEPWYKKAAEDIASTIQCFDIGNAASYSRVSGNSGYIGSDADTGRPDQYKYFDAIYAGQVEDLRLNANKLDVNQLREEAMRKAVSGALRGKDSTLFTKIEKFISFTKQSNTRYQGTSSVNPSPWRLIFNVSDSSIGATNQGFNGYKTGRHKPNGSWVLYKGDNGKELISASIVHGAYENNEHYFLPWIPDDVNGSAMTTQRQIAMDEIDSLFPIGTKIEVYLIDAVELSAEFDSLPWVDIIGSPENIAATFPAGVVGQWVPKLPIDGATLLPLNRKYVSHFSSVVTVDNGSSWSTGGAGNAFYDITNTWSYNAQKDEVRLISYETLADISTPNTSSKVCSHVSDVWGGNDSRINFGSRLQHSLTRKVPTVNAYTTNTYTPVIQSNLLNEQFIVDEFPKHSALPVLGQKQGSYGVKALPTITEKNGLFYMQLHGAEMVYTAPNLSNMTVITAGQAASVEKGKTYILKGFDNASVNRTMVALATSSNFTWSASAFDGYTVLDTGEIITNTGVAYNLLRLYTGGFGDDQTIPIVNGEDVKTDLNGNTVKVFCHHTQLPLGIASH